MSSNEFDFLQQSNLHQNKNGKNEMSEIYIVEDDILLGKSIKNFLQLKLKNPIIWCQSPEECIANINLFNYFILITDIGFSQSSQYDGLGLIDYLKTKTNNFHTIAMTGLSSIELAISATKKGVFQYLTKPFEMNELLSVVDRLILNANNKMSGSQKFEIPGPQDFFMGMVGRSPAMKLVYDLIKKVSHSDSTVFISGASGTGKELVARAIHHLSARKENPIVSVNCGAIPHDLLESELFGHEKGAFTGAISFRKGRFEMANKGTIFLDEIGDMPFLLQVKLLRVLQSREIERVGSNDPIEINVRIITATHRDLEQAMKVGQFREDLYYRLNVIPIKIPTLAERREDIPLLIGYFLSKFVSANGSNAISFSHEAYQTLLNYSWPGNVRELENLMERLVILKGGSEVDLDDLPPRLKSVPQIKVIMNQHQEEKLAAASLPVEGLDLKQHLSDIEDELIKQALKKSQGNKNQASKLLAINRTTLIEKMKKKGIVESFI